MHKGCKSIPVSVQNRWSDSRESRLSWTSGESNHWSDHLKIQKLRIFSQRYPQWCLWDSQYNPHDQGGYLGLFAETARQSYPVYIFMYFHIIARIEFMLIFIHNYKDQQTSEGCAFSTDPIWEQLAKHQSASTNKSLELFAKSITKYFYL